MAGVIEMQLFTKVEYNQ